MSLHDRIVKMLAQDKYDDSAAEQVFGELVDKIIKLVREDK